MLRPKFAERLLQRMAAALTTASLIVGLTGAAMASAITLATGIFNANALAGIAVGAGATLTLGLLGLTACLMTDGSRA
jgi:hypothetical protein